jgi:4-amino-4-deoxy-L-arabinose transferase-like glycosyltransferase
MNPKPFYRILPYVACLLACTAVNLIYFPTNTVFPDEQRILASAVKFAATGEFWVNGDRAWEMPGAALFFAPWVWLLGLPKAITAIRFSQTLLLLIQCGLVAFITRRVADRDSSPFIAAWMTALYPFLIFYQGLLLTETLFNTLLLAGIAALYAWTERGARLSLMFLAACIYFAAATMTKATLTFLPPLLLALSAWIAAASWRRALTVLLAASCLYGALLSPWWIRNAMLLGYFVPFTTSSAQNLYLGNNPKNPHVGIDWAHDVEPDVAARLLAIPNEVERQRAFNERAAAYIKEYPSAFVAAAAKKFVRLWNIIPNAAEFRGVYALISALTFGPVLLLAILGVLWQWRQWRRFAPLLISIGYFTLVHIVTIASLRYRLPLEPLLIVIAATCIGAILQRTWRSASQIA